MTTIRVFFAVVALPVCAALAGGCVTRNNPNNSGGSGGYVPPTGGTGGPIGGSGGSGGITFEPCPGLCTDFPVDAIVEASAPSNPSSLFGGSPSGAGPCITEPEENALFPNNWLRPRIKWSGNASAYQVTIQAAKEANDLVVYTGDTSWTMPYDMWRALASHIVDEAITVKVRAAGGGESTTMFTIAPVAAAGSMVFWAADPRTAGKDLGRITTANYATIIEDSYLRGFSVGEEGTIPVLKIDQVLQPTVANDINLRRRSTCIGCHSGVPGGNYVAWVDAWPWSGVIADIRGTTAGEMFPEIGAGGLKTLQMPWAGPFTFSRTHWSPGDYTAIFTSTFNTTTGALDGALGGAANDRANLAWVDIGSPDLAAGQRYPTPGGPQFGYLARTGDTGSAAFPTWSHDGANIVYVSAACTSATTCGTLDGRLENGPSDLYTVPYNNRAGGAASKLPGASEANMYEYYPAFSPDDRLVAFNAVPSGKLYANPLSELYVVHYNGGQGGQAHRLVANNPPACSGKTSPGINNHWGRWSPEVKTYGDRAFYWLIFSSNRYGIPSVTVTQEWDGSTKVVEVTQLYITGVVVTETSIQSYGAIYLWNQPDTSLNATPAWETFQIPPVL